MPDPFLDAHRDAPHQYSITGFPLFGIYEQQLRGSELAKRLIEVQEISSSRPLLVIGATVVGATAALDSPLIYPS